jgi:hypothetical protein
LPVTIKIPRKYNRVKCRPELFTTTRANMSGKKIGNAEREKDDVVPVDEGGTPAVESPKTMA